MTHRANNNLHVPLQSAYRPYHSTETALLKVHNDILRALDKGECVFLVLLDLSAAFDTVDHDKLKHHLEQEFAVTDGALQWLNSYLQNRQQAVLVRGVESSERTLAYGVPQGSVLMARIIQGLYYSTCQPNSIFWHQLPWLCWWYSALCSF